MSDRVVLVYDVGTQSSRALLINQRGEILAKSQVKHLIPYESPYPGWAEKDADFYYENICQASRELKTRYPELFAKTEAVSVTTIRDTVVCVDREGKPLRPAILWLDKRKAEGKPVFSQVTRMLLNARLAEIPAGCEGLLFQPYFTPNVTMPTARGAVIGFSDRHTRIHIYRAIIEGINFALMDGLRLMEKRAGHKFREIYLGGGGSQSREICQITADMFGIPTVRTQTYEVTGVGCAMAAFVGLGVFGSYEEAAEAMVHKRDVFEPDMEQNRIYRRLYEEVFKNIYGRLSGLYERLQEIYQEEENKIMI